MAEESRPLEEKKLTLGTKARTNANTGSTLSSDSPSERPLSGSGRTEDTLEGAGAAAEHHIMGSSNQPISMTANTSGAEARDSLSGRTISGSRKTEGVFGGAGVTAEPQNVTSSNQPLSSGANGSANRFKISSDSSAERTFSVPGNAEKNNVGASVGAGHQNTASSDQPFSGNASTLKAGTNPADMDDSNPSSLHSTSTCSSYSLEISLSTASNEKESQPLPLQTPPESRNDRNKQINPLIPPEETKLAVTNFSRASAPGPPHQSAQPAESVAGKVTRCTDMLGNCQIVTSKNSVSSAENAFSSITSGNGKLGAQPFSKLASQPPKSASVQSTERMDSFSFERKSAEDEEEMFYAFVILHAPEDAEEAARLKARLERASSTTGATFAEDFAEPGRSPFRCVEDAINNSAYIMLLLTANFNTRLNEMNTDSALINSIEKPHKYNTVIPLLPRDNSLTSAELPMVLRTKFPMRERDRAFEIMARRVLDPEKIRNQKKIWKQELLVRKQQEKQQQLQDENRRHKDFIRESEKVRELENQRMHLLMQQQRLLHPYAPQPQWYPAFPGGAQPFGPVPQQWPEPTPQPPSSIHIQNAKYIMIGNDSTMTVRGDSSGDEDSS
ncbi:TIR domain-containing adapter molecule 1 [Colossoma macropomum]|uniref:TIR domain-containing adapter molecule 1 n=1 Tax=Colossoma macropomum TaxID=42526 RepID=UPI001864213F|nr:TIR domain-containing adapter molecule 1 [Colossoma macropomum]